VKNKHKPDLRGFINPNTVEFYDELSRIPEEAIIEWLEAKEDETKQKILQAGFDIPGCLEFVPHFYADTRDMIRDIEKGIYTDLEASPRKKTIRLNAIKGYQKQLDVLGVVYRIKKLREERIREDRIREERIKEGSTKITSLHDGTISGVFTSAQKIMAAGEDHAKRGRPVANPARPFEWKGTEETRSRLLQLLQIEGFIPNAPKAETRRVFFSIFPMTTMQMNERTKDFLPKILWRGTTPELGELLRQLRDLGLLGQSNGFYKKAAARFLLSDGTMPSVRYLQSSSATIKEIDRKRIVAVIKKLS
jgi:hypothetical protein